MANFQLVTAESHTLKADIRKFWYDVYVEEMGKQPASADSTTRELSQQIDPEKITYSSKLVISPQYRGGASMARLVRYAYEQSRIKQVELDLLLAAPRLLSLYNHLGFHSTGVGHHLSGVGIVVPMALAMEDLIHLKKVRSPLVKIAENYPISTTGYDRIRDIFPTIGGQESTTCLSMDDAWDELADNAFRSLPTSEGLRLTESERALLSTSGHKIYVGSDECVLDEREPGNSIFLVLSGVIEVTVRTDTLPRTLAVLGPGQVFGERSLVGLKDGYERFHAITDSEIIVLNADDVAQKLYSSEFGRIAVMLLRGAIDRFGLLLRDVAHR